jgi:hypothetical protein
LLAFDILVNSLEIQAFMLAGKGFLFSFVVFLPTGLLEVVRRRSEACGGRVVCDLLNAILDSK